MYYKKYFSGSVDATSTTSMYWMGLDKEATSTARSSGHIKNRSDVVGNALVSTLQDIGYTNAYWDSTSGYLFLDKTNSLCGFYIDVQSSYVYFSRGVQKSDYSYLINGHTSESTSTSSNYSVSTSPYGNNFCFSTSGYSAATYQFYVTVIGEPTGIMAINIGAYNNPSLGYISLYIGKGIDKRDNLLIYAFNMSSASNIYNNLSAFTIQNQNAETIALNNSIATSSSPLTILDQYVVIIDVFMKYGFIVLSNTYFNPGLSTGFYEIDGDVYYVTSYYMTKCVTTI